MKYLIQRRLVFILPVALNLLKVYDMKELHSVALVVILTLKYAQF